MNAQAKIAPRRTWLGLLVPALLAFAILIGLGTWQIQRKAWKEALIATLQQDHILAARARGIPPWRILSFDALRLSSFSLVTLAGVSLGRTIGTTVVVETLFGLPGLGQLAVQSVTQQDLPVIIGLVMLAAAFVVVCNFAVDMFYAVLDPRVRAH